jgi:hypothetical protein
MSPAVAIVVSRGDPDMDSESVSAVTAPSGQQIKGWAVVLQVAVLIFALPALAVGAYLLYGMTLPSRCGDFSGATTLGVLWFWVFEVPNGLLVLGIGLAVKRGSPTLRKLCIGTSIIALVLPFIASLFQQIFHCH